MNLVDRNRLVDLVLCATLGQPPGVRPFKSFQIADNGRGPGRQFCAKTNRIRFERHHVTVAVDDLVLVRGSVAQTGQKNLVYTRRTTAAHHVTTAIPSVEITDNRNAQGIRRPDSEMRAVHTFMSADMRAKRIPKLIVRAFAQQVLVHLTQLWTKRIGIALFPRVRATRHSQCVVEPFFAARDHACKNAIGPFNAV